MALDRYSLAMIEPRAQGASVLCLGYPEHPAGIETIGWLRAIGARNVEVVDVIAHFGCERIVDLNEPQQWPPIYDLVINPGTLEHCFNVGVAWANAWAAVSGGGWAVHVFPASMLNHGFWNVSPVAINDWCAANGGIVEAMRYALNGSGEEVRPSRQIGVATGRPSLPPETVLYALCRKIEDKPTTWPTQGVYRR